MYKILLKLCRWKKFGFAETTLLWAKMLLPGSSKILIKTTLIDKILEKFWRWEEVLGEMYSAAANALLHKNPSQWFWRGLTHHSPFYALCHLSHVLAYFVSCFSSRSDFQNGPLDFHLAFHLASVSRMGWLPNLDLIIYLEGNVVKPTPILVCLKLSWKF